MGKNKNTTPVVDQTAGVKPETVVSVVETPVVTPEVITPETIVPVVEETQEATIIPSGRFIAENGDEFEFAVSSFTFRGKVYTKEKALSDHADVLEHLISVKSFILKKV